MTRARNIETPTSMPAGRAPINGEDRARFGGLVSIREIHTDERRTLHAQGKGYIRRIAEQMDALPGTWRVVALCTPETIFRDLQGTRKDEWQMRVHYPEQDAFGKIGRLDLLDAFFDPALPRGQTHG